MRVQDAEHVIRSQCLFLFSVYFQFIRRKVFEPSQPPLAVLGCGRVARMILGSFVELGMPPESIMICTRDALKAAEFRVRARGGRWLTYQLVMTSSSGGVTWLHVVSENDERVTLVPLLPCHGRRWGCS
jgi:hypothetical protein